MRHILLNGVKYEFYTPFLPNSKSFYLYPQNTFFLLAKFGNYPVLLWGRWKGKKGGKSKGREREEERVVHRSIVLNNFFKRNVFFEKIMGPSEGLR